MYEFLSAFRVPMYSELLAASAGWHKAVQLQKGERTPTHSDAAQDWAF
jgi:hypothetical protein